MKRAVRSDSREARIEGVARELAIAMELEGETLASARAGKLLSDVFADLSPMEVLSALGTFVAVYTFGIDDGSAPMILAAFMLYIDTVRDRVVSGITERDGDGG